MGWGTGNIGGGGSGGLNFKIVGGTSQPTNSKENTIWVNTDVPITSYIFSASEPEAPEEGTVWISTGTSSPIAFSATKKNPVMVYPISAKQYISGAWVDVTAKSYQNGEWVEWLPKGALYYRGNEVEDITGGWSQFDLSSTYWRYETPGKNADNVAMSVTSGSSYGVHSGLATNNAINLSNVKKICINVKHSALAGTAAHVGLQILSNRKPVDSKTYAAFLELTNGQTGIAELNTESLNNSYYVALVAMCEGSGGKAELTVDEVVMYE